MPQINIIFKAKVKEGLEKEFYRVALEDFFHKKIDLVRDETLKPQVKSYIQKDISYV
ncbi:MAG: hypothetical protein U9O64_02785 [Campylobacterota bacterium]|nr:hypothetical protein [Campylobacterota bacterium]